jgi:hypothetical protein
VTQPIQDKNADITAVIRLVLRARSGSDSSSRALIAEVSRGIRPETEHYAAPYILPRLEPSSEGRRAGVFRAAALTAQYNRIAQSAQAAPASSSDTATAESGQDAAEAAGATGVLEVRRRRGGKLGLALKALAVASENRDAEMRSIGAKVQILPLLGREQAVKIIDGLLARLDNTGIAVDFCDLARTLAYWETSQPDADRSRRQRIVFDFFS